MPDLAPVRMQNVRIAYLNFSGKPDNFNPNGGKRTFVVILPQDVAEAMAKDGWNVKFPEPRDDGEVREPHISVEASYRVRPPKVFVITSRGKTQWGEEQISMLDWADILNVDIKINPYAWDIGGRGGIKAYLETLYVTIEEDELDLKYADMPTLGVPHTEVDYDQTEVTPAWRK